MPIKSRAILIKGTPGSGKTTLVKFMAESMRDRVDGFYTLELRDSLDNRIGFDIVDVRTHIHYPLARKTWRPPHFPTVGRYGVLPGALDPLLKIIMKRCTEEPHLWVIDELGKMESYSPTLVPWLESRLLHSQARMVLTGPERTLTFYDKILNELNPFVLHLSTSSRSSIKSLLIDWLKQPLP